MGDWGLGMGHGEFSGNAEMPSPAYGWGCKSKAHEGGLRMLYPELGEILQILTSNDL